MLFAERDPAMFILPLAAGRPRCGAGGFGCRRAPPMDVFGPLLWGLRQRAHCPTSARRETGSDGPQEEGTPGRGCPRTAPHATLPKGEVNSRAEAATEKATWSGEGRLNNSAGQHLAAGPWRADVDMAGFRPADIHVTSHQGGFCVRATRVTSRRPRMASRMQLTHFVEAPPGVERREVRVWLGADGVLHFAEKDAVAPRQDGVVDAETPRKDDVADTDATRTAEKEPESDSEAAKSTITSKPPSMPKGKSIDHKSAVAECMEAGGDSQKGPDDSEDLVLATEDKEGHVTTVNVDIAHNVTTKDNDVHDVTVEEPAVTDNDDDMHYVMVNANDMHDVTANDSVIDVTMIVYVNDVTNDDVTTKDDDINDVTTKDTVIDVTTVDDVSDAVNDNDANDITKDEDVNDVIPKDDDKNDVTIKEDGIHEITTTDNVNNVTTNNDTDDNTDTTSVEEKTVTDVTDILAQSQKAAFRMCLDVSGYDTSDIKVKVVGRQVAVHAERSVVTDCVETLHKLSRTFTLPPGVDADTVRSALTSDGTMTIFGQSESEEQPREKMVSVQRVD